MSEHRYEGTWKLQNIKEVQDGILFIDDEKGMIRLKLFVIAENGWGFAHNIKTICPIITGNLIGNNKITLVDNTVIKRHEHLGAYTELVIEVRWAFWGLHYDSKKDIKFKKYSVDMDGILNWCNLCRFDTKDFQNYQWIKQEKVKMRINEGLTIYFIPICKGGKGTALIEKNLQLEQYIEIDFEYDNETCLEDFISDFQKMEMLITIGAGAIPLRRKLYYYDSRNKLLPGVNDIIKPKEIYVGDKPYSNGYETYAFNMLFRLSDIALGKQESIKKWNEIVYKIEPAINLYFSIIRYEDFPIEMQYLNIVQALETYHARFKFNDLKKYRKHVLELFKCENIDDIDNEQRNAYYDVTQSDSNITYIILKSRIVDLMNDDFRLKLYPLYADGNIVFLYDFIEKVIDTRHYYTHYGKTKEEKAFKGLDLQYAIEVLKEVFEYHFLIELDLRNSGTVSMIYKRHENINYWYTERCEKIEVIENA